MYLSMSWMLDSMEIQPLGNWGAVSPHLAVVHTWAWYCWNWWIFHTTGQFCLCRMESCSKFCGGSPLDCCSSDICSSLAPAESIKASTVTMVHYWPPPTHTHPCARSHTHTDTHKHTLSHAGRQWHTDKDTHSHIQDTRPFPNMYIPHTQMRSSVLSSASCPLGQGVLLRESSRAVLLYTLCFCREVLTSCCQPYWWMFDSSDFQVLLVHRTKN